VRDAGGAGQAQHLLNIGAGGPGIPTGWSPDGRYLVYAVPDSDHAMVLWVLPMSPEPGGDPKPVSYLRSPFTKCQGCVSPDGRWMAYVSAESQTPEVYVSPFPNPTAKERISIAGGSQPRWRADGQELFYLAADHTLMSAKRSPSGFQAPVPLFATRPAEYYAFSRNDYAPSRDGQRFLINTRYGVPVQPGIHVMVGWQSPRPR
jgi:Tol biopolymer transport system component